MKKKALISVYNKENIFKLAEFFIENNIEIISTGGTSKLLQENGFKITDISNLIGFEEILDGRVKTLHPNIHGGILARRNNPVDIKTLNEKNIFPIDFVIVNLYPFFDKINENISFEEKLEFIDVGGPTLLRAAAKNFKDVIVICDINDYDLIIKEIKSYKDVCYETRKKLASKAFNLISSYDASISNFLTDNDFPDYLSLSYRNKTKLRYGENPHQKAVLYTKNNKKGLLNNIEQLSGKDLSFNNIKDIDAAWKIVSEFEETACCAVKHNIPCGAAIGETVNKAFENTYNCDQVSIFGGIVAFNKVVDKNTALKLKDIFLEVIIAPDFEQNALEILKKKKNLRLIKSFSKPTNNYEYTSVDGGILCQEIDKNTNYKLKIVTETKPNETELDDMIFGMKIVKHVKSNAIVIVKNKMLTGSSGGQTNRIDAVKIAIKKSNADGIMASDGFFPFDDIVKECYKNNIKSIIQPGGSKNDQMSIEYCNKYGLNMVFTGIRHFKH